MASGPSHPSTFIGRSVLVTGAGGGIGAAIAQAFAAHGALVYIHYATSKDRAEDIAHEIISKGGTAKAVQGDLRTKEGVDAVFNHIEEDGPGIDILINNAGIYPISSLLDMSEEDWKNMFAANVDSAFFCTQRAARKMADGGNIINIASLSATMPGPLHSHYNASKAALVMLTRSSAQELGPSHIRVNCISPGLVNRPGLEEVWPEGVASWMSKAPLKQLGEAEDVANACLFLASDAARWISGQNLVLDGGMSSAPIY